MKFESKTQCVLIASMCVLTLFAWGSVSAQDLDPIKWKIKTDSLPPHVEAGSKFDLQVVAGIDEGWHLYSPEQPAGGPIPTRISLPENQKFKLAGGIVSPPALVVFDPNFNLDTQFYEGEAVFTLPLQVAADVVQGKQTLTVNTFFQTCNDTRCLPPKIVKLTADVQIGAAAQSVSSSSAKTSDSPATPQKLSQPKTGQQNSTVDFAFVDFTGKPRKISEFRGKFVLIDFWATWCKPCMADIPKLKELYQKHKDAGFEIVGMDAETLSNDDEAPDPDFAKQQAEQARKIVATRGVIWTQATAETAVPVAKNVFAVKTLPTKILLDKDGKVIARIGEKDDLTAIVEGLLGAGK